MSGPSRKQIRKRKSADRTRSANQATSVPTGDAAKLLANADARRNGHTNVTRHREEVRRKKCRQPVAA